MAGQEEAPALSKPLCVQNLTVAAPEWHSHTIAPHQQDLGPVEPYSFSFSHQEMWTQICTPPPETAGKSLPTWPLMPCNSCTLLSNPCSLHGRLETDSLGNLKHCLEKDHFYSPPRVKHSGNMSVSNLLCVICTNANKQQLPHFLLSILLWLQQYYHIWTSQT